MNKSLIIRIVVNISAIFSFAFLPWWVTVLILFLGIISFHFFWEPIVYGFAFDSIFGISTNYFGGFESVCLVFGILSFFVNHFFHKWFLVRYVR